MAFVGNMIAASSAKPDKKRLVWDNIEIETNENHEVLPDDSEENMKMIKLLKALEYSKKQSIDLIKEPNESHEV
jgi:hypothetical protein